MVSDDTEHTLLVARALFISGGEPARFRSALAAGLRRWILLAPAGVGFATLRACLRLLTRVSPERSGVFSAGNGPAMRAPLLGVCCGADPAHLRALVQASTHITHTDPKADYGALAVALAAYQAAQGDWGSTAYLSAVSSLLPAEDRDAAELSRLIRLAAESAAAGEETSDFAAGTLGLPEQVTGYIYHTVPVALHAWLRHPTDFRAAIRSAVACGGDTDTVAAITGAMVGAGVGPEGIPAEWLTGLREWPCSVDWIMTLAARLADAFSGAPQPEARLPAWSAAPALLRNLLFLCVVLYHGLRRLLPPY